MTAFPLPARAGKLPLLASDLRGLLKLGVDATVGVTDIVEAMHHTIGSRSGIVGAAPSGRTSGITGFVYRTDAEVLINRAQVAELRSLYIDQRVTEIREANERRDPGTDRNDRFVRMFAFALGDPFPGDPMPPYAGEPVGLARLVQLGQLARGQAEVDQALVDELARRGADAAGPAQGRRIDMQGGAGRQRGRAGGLQATGERLRPRQPLPRPQLHAAMPGRAAAGGVASTASRTCTGAAASSRPSASNGAAASIATTCAG